MSTGRDLVADLQDLAQRFGNLTINISIVQDPGSSSTNTSAAGSSVQVSTCSSCGPVLSGPTWAHRPTTSEPRPSCVELGWPAAQFCGGSQPSSALLTLVGVRQRPKLETTRVSLPLEGAWSLSQTPERHLSSPARPTTTSRQ